MSKTSSASKIKMKSFEDLFGTNEVVGAKNISGEIRDIPLNSLHTFRNHPFKVREEKLDELVESVKQHGVLVPGIARMRPQGGYEIIAGHTRKAACELAGLDTMPMFIRNLNDDEATIVMVDSNIQREDILPSERARAYSMRYYAMKHQGIKGNGSSLELMSEETGENQKKIQRYIRLARLNDGLLDLLDANKLGLVQGVDISFLNEQEQQWVLDAMFDMNIFPKAYLEMHRPILFNELVLSDKLFEHCAEIDETARNRMELIVRSLAEQNGVTEQLKAENQMEWVRQMNACKAQAEEIVKVELIYD